MNKTIFTHTEVEQAWRVYTERRDGIYLIYAVRGDKKTNTGVDVSNRRIVNRHRTRYINRASACNLIRW